MEDPKWWNGKGRGFAVVFKDIVDNEENEEISNLQEESSEEE